MKCVFLCVCCFFFFSFIINNSVCVCVIFCFFKSESRLGLHSMPKKCWEQTRHTYLRALRSRAAMFSRHRFARPCVPSFFFASLSARLSRPTLRSSWMRFWYGASPITSCTSSRTNCLFMSVDGVAFVSFFVLCLPPPSLLFIF